MGFPNPLDRHRCLRRGHHHRRRRPSAWFGRWYWAGWQVGVTAGAVFVVWLWSQALFSIYILCLYCMIVWAATVPTILLTVRNLAHGVIPPRRGRRASPPNGPGPIAITYVAVAASVFFRFFLPSPASDQPRATSAPAPLSEESRGRGLCRFRGAGTGRRATSHRQQTINRF
ncbi:vitamin K epoxide reductase family protein [Kocuria rhizophila]|nr:vitamin K epoxide reductase family protein [Kocuria rhizophila]